MSGGKIVREVIPQMTTPFRSFGDMVATFQKLPVSGLVPNPRVNVVKLVPARPVENKRVKGTAPGGVSYGQTVYCAPRTITKDVALGQTVRSPSVGPAPRLEYTPLRLPVKLVKAQVSNNSKALGCSPGGVRYGMPMMSG